jgi:outer membrane receptor protein involved in Fe transport
MLLRTTAACLWSCLIAVPIAVAQETTPDNSSGLEQITVTARKVSENIQVVPLSVTALTSKDIEASGITDLNGLVQQVPGITLYGTGSESAQAPVIRGQYDFNYAANTDGSPNVAVFLDGIYLQNPNAISVGVFDLDRVEVIEGPVSALYGRNAFAGAINYVSKIPTDTFEANLNSRIGEYGTQQVRADVNGPLIPGVLRAGVAVNFENSDGPYRDAITGVGAGQVAKQDYKGELVFTPVAALNISAGYYLGHDHFGQDPIVTATPNCAIAGGGNICGQYVANPLAIADIPAASGDSGNNRDVQAAHLKINYDFGFADVTYLGGYNRVIERDYQDFAGLRYGLPFALYPGPGSVNAYELFGDDDDTKDTSHELRITSKQNQSFRWSFGGDFFKSNLITTTLIGVDDSQVPAGQSTCSPANFFFGCFWDTSNGSPSPNKTEAAINEKTYSGFLSADYDVLDQLTVGGEYRQTEDKQNMDIRYNSFLGPTFPEPYGAIQPATFVYGNYRFYARYKLTDATMFYASVADGTKNGGFNTQSALKSNQSYGPETNTTYEGGIKTTLLDHKLQLNADIFHINSNGIQFFFPQGNGINTVIQNIGGTTNTGFEFSAVANPIEGLSLRAGFAYADPKFKSGTYDSDDAAICALVPTCAPRITTITTGSGPTSVVNLNGLQEPGSSKETANLSLDYTRAVFDDVHGFLHIDYRYNAKQYTQITAADLSYTAATNRVNLRAGANWENYTLALNVFNLTDDRTPIFANQATELNAFGHEFTAQLPTPRIVSVEFVVHIK